MSLHKIRLYPDPILKKKAEPLTSFGDKEQKLFDEMIETMYVEDGVGLAAPQIGISQRIFVASPSMKKGEEYVMVNPEILEAKGRESGVEGCLSLPGIAGEVPRAKKIRFRYQDRFGQVHEMEVKDLFARIVQHELDHLDGVLLIDRVDFNMRQQLLARYQAL
ncbi:MAG TPA: peptide deformylase [bacterium]|nr:peptide deformylase [bacterium]